MDAEIATSVPGLEVDTVHKYAVNVLANFKPNGPPITIKVAHTLLADADIFESFCEHERDRAHLENAKPQR